jgi:hypothetical protein
MGVSRSSVALMRPLFEKRQHIVARKQRQPQERQSPTAYVDRQKIPFWPKISGKLLGARPKMIGSIEMLEINSISNQSNNDSLDWSFSVPV